MAELIDYSYARFSPAEVKTLGKVGVIRYVASGRPEVSATRAEVDAFRAAGLAFVAVWQRGKDRALLGREAGVLDGKDAAAYCATLGGTGSDPVHFSVDIDATPAQLPAVLAYFEGVASVLGWARVGAYGGIRTLTYLHERTPIGLWWQTASWSGGQLAPFATLYQYSINQTLNGKAVDFDRSLKPFYGQWSTGMNELAAKSSSRGGAEVLWITVHTAEGPTDDMPADPALDAGSARALLAYFKRADVSASAHAIADDDVLLDELVPYDRAAWTLRGGNSRSDNLELCGMASWPRSTWLKHVGMLNHCARWIASRVKARPGIPCRFIGTSGVQQRAKGVIGHVNYTEATGDGTHWDPGPNFPWDYVIGKASAYLTGTEEDTLSAEDVKAINDHTDDIYRLLARGEIDGKVSAAHYPNSIAGLRGAVAGQADALSAVRAAVDAVRADQSVSGEREEKALTMLAEIEADLPAPTPEPTPEPTP